MATNDRVASMNLARYKRPAAFKDSSGAVAQPLATAPGPHMTNSPAGAYERVIAAPDAAVRNSVDNSPPVHVART